MQKKDPTFLMRKKCDKKKLEMVKFLIKSENSIDQILKQTDLTPFDLSPYLNVAFYDVKDANPLKYMSKETFDVIMKAIDELEEPFPKNVLNKCKEIAPNMEFSWEDIRITTGVYFRDSKSPQKKEIRVEKPKAAIASAPQSISKLRCKWDISEQKPLIKVFREIFEYDRQFAYVAVITHLCFMGENAWKIPACHSNRFHFQAEHCEGVIEDAKEPLDDDKVPPYPLFEAIYSGRGMTADEFESMLLTPVPYARKIIVPGGNVAHSMRVAAFVRTQLELDDPKVFDFSTKSMNMVYGNDHKPWEKAMLLAAALIHDSFSCGPTDKEYPFTAIQMDPAHAIHHRHVLAGIGRLVPPDRWEIFLQVIENHMWKYDKTHTPIAFDDGKMLEGEKKDEFYYLYRLIKMFQLSDTFASRREFGKGQAIIDYLTMKFKLSGVWGLTPEELYKLEITNSSLDEAFGHHNMDAIIRCAQKLLEVKKRKN